MTNKSENFTDAFTTIPAQSGYELGIFICNEDGSNGHFSYLPIVAWVIECWFLPSDCFPRCRDFRHAYVKPVTVCSHSNSVTMGNIRIVKHPNGLIVCNDLSEEYENEAEAIEACRIAIKEKSWK